MVLTRKGSKELSNREIIATVRNVCEWMLSERSKHAFARLKVDHRDIYIRLLSQTTYCDIEFIDTNIEVIHEKYWNIVLS